jgi:hypothetical protein
MLKQQDLAQKITGGDLKCYIAFSTYEIDFHVYGSISRQEVRAFNQNELQPSGIPYGCLIPKTLNNVLIACRAFGASHIALAARRVNKDMAQLGWAAGHATRIALETDLTDVRKVDIGKLQGKGYIDLVTGINECKKRIKDGLIG